jgi:hypothetical protein
MYLIHKLIELIKGFLVFGFIFRILNFLDVIFSQWYVS